MVMVSRVAQPAQPMCSRLTSMRVKLWCVLARFAHVATSLSSWLLQLSNGTCTVSPAVAGYTNALASCPTINQFAGCGASICTDKKLKAAYERGRRVPRLRSGPSATIDLRFSLRQQNYCHSHLHQVSNFSGVVYLARRDDPLSAAKEIKAKEAEQVFDIWNGV